jgi:hypothetical protein
MLLQSSHPINPIKKARQCGFLYIKSVGQEVYENKEDVRLNPTVLDCE